MYKGLTYADMFTFAGKVATEYMGGDVVPWKPGRSDAVNGDICTEDGRLPDAAQGANHIREVFYRMGFNDREIVALSGAHTLGECHANRSGYVGPWTRGKCAGSEQGGKGVIRVESWDEGNLGQGNIKVDIAAKKRQNVGGRGEPKPV